MLPAVMSRPPRFLPSYNYITINLFDISTVNCYKKLRETYVIQRLVGAFVVFGTPCLFRAGKVSLTTGHKGPEEEYGDIALLFLCPLLSMRWVVSATLRSLCSRERNPVPSEVGRAPGPVRKGVENLSPTGNRFPDSRARSESLYLLSYPGPPI
jgi:hypothetical protein